MDKSFNIDKETYADLYLLDNQDGSIFDIFNCATTEGGAAQISTWFENPTADIEEINRRQKCIALMENIEFPSFDSRLLKDLKVYLSQTQNADQGTLFSSIRNLFTIYEPSFYYRKRYILDIINLLAVFHKYVEKNVLIFKAMAIVGLEDIRDCIHKIPKKPIHFYTIDHLEILLKEELRDVILAIIDSIYLLDACRALAKVKKEKNLHFPDFKTLGSTSGIEIQGLYHLFTKSPVVNDVLITKKENIWFLTGANMAGKSTLIKSLGLAIYLAHLGFPVPARMMRLAPLAGLFTSINSNDKIHLGYSHFSNEVNRLKTILDQIEDNRPAFIIVDELFKGTNYEDAYLGIYEVIKRFSKTNAFVIISTHLTELSTKIAENLPAVSFMRLTTDIKDGQPLYTYKLQKGVAN